MKASNATLGRPGRKTAQLGTNWQRNDGSALPLAHAFACRTDQPRHRAGARQTGPRLIPDPDPTLKTPPPANWPGWPAARSARLARHVELAHHRADDGLAPRLARALFGVQVNHAAAAQGVKAGSAPASGSSPHLVAAQGQRLAWVRCAESGRPPGRHGDPAHTRDGCGPCPLGEAGSPGRSASITLRRVAQGLSGRGSHLGNGDRHRH